MAKKPEKPTSTSKDQTAKALTVDRAQQVSKEFVLAHQHEKEKRASEAQHGKKTADAHGKTSPDDKKTPKISTRDKKTSIDKGQVKSADHVPSKNQTRKSEAGSKKGELKSVKSDTTRASKAGRKSVAIKAPASGTKKDASKPPKQSVAAQPRQTVLGRGHKDFQDARLTNATESQHKRIVAELEYVRFPSIMGWYFDGNQFGVPPFALNAYYAVYFNNLQEEMDTIAHYENDETFTEKARRNFWPPHWMGPIFRTRGVYLDFEEFTEDPPQSPPEFNFEHEHNIISIYGPGKDDDVKTISSRRATNTDSKLSTMDKDMKKRLKKCTKKDLKSRIPCKKLSHQRLPYADTICHTHGPVCWEDPKYRYSEQRIPMDRPCNTRSFGGYYAQGPSCGRNPDCGSQFPE